VRPTSPIKWAAPSPLSYVRFVRESRKIEYPEAILGHYNYVYDANHHAADKSQDKK
jgi:hypothetical protein